MKRVKAKNKEYYVETICMQREYLFLLMGKVKNISNEKQIKNHTVKPVLLGLYIFFKTENGRKR